MADTERGAPQSGVSSDTPSPQKPAKPAPGKPASPAKKGLTAILDKQAVEKALLNLQRGANDAAVVELRRKDGGHVPARVVVNAVGQMFYRVGTQTEYLFVWVIRLLRFLLAGALGLLRGLAGAFAAPVLHIFAAMWHDLSAPWRRMAGGFRRIRQTMRQERDQGGKPRKAGMAYLRQGIRANKGLLLNGLAWLFPLGAAAVMVFTVQQVFANGFSLRVTYNGDVIGFVESDTVWDSAVQIVNSRIVATDGQQQEQWSASPEFSIVPVNPAARSTATAMADTIISNSSDQIQNATGLTVDGTLVGVTQDSETLQAALDALLDPYRTGNADHQVSFAHDIQLVPGVYYTSSIHSADEAIAALQAVPEYLQVKTVDVEEYDEEIPVAVVEQESSDYYEGIRRVLQRGRAGSQHVVAQVTRIDGVEVERTPLETTVLEEMVPQIELVGTKEVTAKIGQVGSGQWTFPVPNCIGGGTYAGHRGYDFRAPYGSPIYACEAGTVIKAEYHWSWGNYVLIDHHNGLYSLYAHCSSLAASVGQQVARGQLIGYVGMTGTATGNHLHLEVWSDPSGARWCLLDPLSFVSMP